jgi:hypothetical protein
VTICTSDGQADDYVARVKELLGAELLHTIEVGITRVDLVGRAKTLPEVAPREISKDFPEGACKMANQPTVLENGRILACCNTTVSTRCKGTPLDLGQLSTTSLGSALQRSSQDVILETIRVFGPAYLARLMVKHGMNDRLSGRYEKGLLCGLCKEITSQPDVVDALRQECERFGTAEQVAKVRAAAAGLCC